MRLPWSMKSPSLCSILTGITVILTTVTIAPDANASKDKYFCAELNGTFRTFARTQRGNMKIMNFVRNISEEWTTQKRCVETSKRFQKFYNAKTLKYIGSGEVNNYPVLCALPSTEGVCDRENMLVTLPLGSNPAEEARTLMDTRNVISGSIVSVNGGTEKLENYIDGNVYYNLDVFEEIILNKEDSSSHLIPQEDITPVQAH